MIRWLKMKIEPKREKRPKPMSFRFSKEAAEQLKRLAEATRKSMAAILEELIAEAYRDTLGDKDD